MIRRPGALALLLPALCTLVACGAAPPSDLTVRVWDPQVAEAYRASLDEFEAETGIAVDVVVVPWSDYWTQLRADVAVGAVDDVFWTNAANYQEFAGTDRIRPVPTDDPAFATDQWESSVVDQYSIDGQLWGVPAISDPGIALIYNENLVTAAGIDPDTLDDLAWDPGAVDDTLRRTARALTLDVNALHPGEPGFDTAQVTQFGYSAANDLNAIGLQFLGGNDAAWQSGDRFAFADAAGIEALAYVVDLINVEHVAPPAQDTNPPIGGDFLRDQFLAGRLALFQTGAYNLANIEENADFDWGIARLPAGPAGAVSVTNGVVFAASADTDDAEAQRRLLAWLGSTRGQRPIGSSGAALPAAVDAQDTFAQSWAARGIDVSPMIDVLGNGYVQAPQGERYAEASDAMQQILNDVFLGRTPPEIGLPAAEGAANAEIGR